MGNGTSRPTARTATRPRIGPVGAISRHAEPYHAAAVSARDTVGSATSASRRILTGSRPEFNAPVHGGLPSQIWRGNAPEAHGSLGNPIPGATYHWTMQWLRTSRIPRNECFSFAGRSRLADWFHRGSLPPSVYPLDASNRFGVLIYASVDAMTRASGTPPLSSRLTREKTECRAQALLAWPACCSNCFGVGRSYHVARTFQSRARVQPKGEHHMVGRRSRSTGSHVKPHSGRIRSVG